MNVLFHSNQLGPRGTEVAMMDYSHYNETLLGNTSFIAFPYGSDRTRYNDFWNRFPGRVFQYASLSELETIGDTQKIDVAYFIKYGTNDGKTLRNCRSVTHVVFDGSEPHTDRYVAISKWLGDKYNIPYVPHIVDLPNIQEDYREALNIPKEAIVFGRHGGYDSFDDPNVKLVVERVASNNPNIYFLFLNTEPFCFGYPNIIHFGHSSSNLEKRAFINTCDGMLYARKRGETFGLSIAEFLLCDKPVICSIEAPERNHIETMGDKGIYFQNDLELSYILTNFVKPSYKYSDLVSEFSPEKVMQKFNEIFLK